MTAGLFQKMCHMMAKAMGVSYHKNYSHGYLRKTHQLHIGLFGEQALQDFKVFSIMISSGQIDEDDLVYHNRRGD